MAEQVSYRVAAEAGREALVRARRAGCSLEEHVVLEAVVALTALSSKLADDVAVAVVAERAGLHPKNAARALGRLRDRGVILYEAGRGRGNVSRVGLPLVETGADPAPLSEIDDAIQVPIRTAPVETGAELAAITETEKGSRIETPEKTASISSAELLEPSPAPPGEADSPAEPPPLAENQRPAEEQVPPGEQELVEEPLPARDRRPVDGLGAIGERAPFSERARTQLAEPGSPGSVDDPVIEEPAVPEPEREHIEAAAAPGPADEEVPGMQPAPLATHLDGSFRGEEAAASSATEAPAPIDRDPTPEELLADRVLDLFNQRAGTDYTFEQWGSTILDRVRDRPDWALEDWHDVIRRAFAVAWWEKKSPHGGPPTPLVIFSSLRQVESTMNVPDRVVAQAESARRASSR